VPGVPIGSMAHGALGPTRPHTLSGCPWGAVSARTSPAQGHQQPHHMQLQHPQQMPHSQLPGQQLHDPLGQGQGQGIPQAQVQGQAQLQGQGQGQEQVHVASSVVDDLETTRR